MAQFDMSFDPANAPESSYGIIPAGWYLAECIKSDLVPTKAGGERLAITWRILGPSHVGRQVIASINTRHDNPQVVTIGQEEIFRIASVAGKKLDRSEHLIGITAEISIIVEPPKNGYDEANRVKKYRAPAGRTAPPVFTAPPATAPWARPKA